LRNSQFPNRLLRFLATVKPTSDLHRRSTFQPRLPINHRLASAIFLRLCLPTQRPTLIDRQILRLAFRSPSNLRWRPTFRPAFQPAFDLRLRPTFRLNLCTDLRLAPPADPPACLPTRLRLAPSIRLPAQPSSRLPACAFVQPSGSAFEPNFRLSSSADPFGAAFRLICSLRRRPTFQPCLTNQTSDTGCCISGSASRSGLRLASSTNLSAWPLNSTSDSPTVESLRRCLPVNLQLAPPINLPALPDGPNLRFLGVASLAPLPANPRLASRFNLRLPSGQSPTCVGDQPSG